MFEESSVYKPDVKVKDPSTGEPVSKFSNIYISGICSGVEMDLDQQRMAKSALDSMKDALDSGVDLRESHDYEYTGLNGAVVDLYLTKDENGIDSLAYKAVLNNPDVDTAARKLYYTLESGTVLGVSVGGYIEKYHYGYNEELMECILMLVRS